FQLALEQRLSANPPADARVRLEAALSGIERLFAGTIHAFCAHLLRERPVDAGMAPGFVELDDVQDARQRRRAWRDYVSAARARGFAPMLELLDAGVKPKDLDGAFATVCGHEDVVFDAGAGEPPAFDAALKDVERFWRELSRLKPVEFDPDSKCKAQQKSPGFDSRLGAVRRTRSLTQLAGLLTLWDKATVTAKWWNAKHGGGDSEAQQAKVLVEAFQAEVVDPFLVRWRAYVHRLAMAVLIEAREAYARARRRLNVVNYVDLLRVTAGLLRESPDVRWALQQKYRWLFIDEFQDTDPIQAEVFLCLAAADPAPGKWGQAPFANDLKRKGRAGTCDPFALPLRPGALFVVGDPKQSIYRFRRADIDVYNRVARRIVATGGDVLSLTANFRSVPAVCAVANTVFPPLFGAYPAPYSPPFTALVPVRDDQHVVASGVASLTVPFGNGKADAMAAEAEAIAAYVQSEVASGRRGFGDFLVLTRQKPRLRHYAGAFDRLEIPVEVSGAGLFCKSPEVQVLALLLRALADPLDAVTLVGVLRGPLFGLSDPDLFRFRQAGGRFELHAPVPDRGDEAAEHVKAATFGPGLAVMRELREQWLLTRRLPLAAAVDLILERSGWLALAATTPGGASAGRLLQAVDEVRQVVEAGGGLPDAASALEEEDESSESEAWPLEPGRRNVVRLMNLHKAKGLEAPVVILADPTHSWDFPASVRIERTGSSPRGHLNIVRPSDKNPRGTVLAQPADWDTHAVEEERYLAAERLRLLYVAGTRAGDLLVVCRVDNPAKNRAWNVFEAFLADRPSIAIPLAHRPARVVTADLSARARKEAGDARAVRDGGRRGATWSVASPSGEKARTSLAARIRAALTEAAAATDIPDTPPHRADAGAAWGSLLHGLLEHAMRHTAATRDDLARLAQWLTVEHPDLRSHLNDALDWVDDVRRMPFWEEAMGGGEQLVEVPFAILRGPGPSASVETSADSPEPWRRRSCPGIPTIHRGIIDLVCRASDGWHIVDYKTDRLDGVADVETELRSRHGAQLGDYADAWQAATGQPVSGRAVVSLRTGRIVPL
ncbi:MAG: UvrD-helicase domain-containing protein, partial [Vicinamibacterales bacterium]|nr:UvrD-helicase domain-containing protein [Vicinamibacterales bacterium]